MTQKRMRIVILAPYPAAGASVRYRMLQFVPLLKAAGYQVVFRPFMTPFFFRIRRRFGIYTPLKGLLFAWATAKRCGDLWRCRHATVVLVHREAFPLGPPLFETLLARRNPAIVYDFDDADFSAVPNAIDQRRFWRDPHKLAKLLTLSRHVIAGNAYLADYARRFNTAVTVIPTVVDTSLVQPLTPPPRERIVIGWIGNWGNAHYLTKLLPMLQELSRRRPIILKLIGGADIDAIAMAGVGIMRVRWSHTTESSDLDSIDIGIMPLGDAAYDQGKCGFKIIQYFLHARPAVASPVGVNCSIITPGVNGFLADSAAEWLDALDKLCADANLRQRYGAAGRRLVETQYSLQAVSAAFMQVIHDTNR